MKALPVRFGESIPAWEKEIYTFLAEKERRSGSTWTAGAYTRTLQRFFGTAGKTPEQVPPPDVFGFAHGIGPSGKEPAAITIGARLACISSFYRFLIRMEIAARNPCGQLERPKVSPSLPAALHGCGHWHPGNRTTVKRHIQGLPGLHPSSAVVRQHPARAAGPRSPREAHARRRTTTRPGTISLGDQRRPAIWGLYNQFRWRWLSDALWPPWRSTLVLVQPDTVIRAQSISFPARATVLHLAAPEVVP